MSILYDIILEDSIAVPLLAGSAVTGASILAGHLQGKYVARNVKDKEEKKKIIRKYRNGTILPGIGLGICTAHHTSVKKGIHPKK